VKAVVEDFMRLSLQGLRGDLAGGVASAIAGLAFALTFGLVAFAPLGSEQAEIGIRAGLIAAIVGNLVASLATGTALPTSGPRASLTLAQGAFVAVLVADPAVGIREIVALSALCIACAGVLQIVFGALRVGTLIKFVPYPVIAGFMCGVAVLIVLAQLPHILGVAPRSDRDWIAAVQPWTIVVSFATAGIVLAVGQRWRYVPAALAALLGGTAIYFVIAGIFIDAALGQRVGPLPGGVPLPTMFGEVVAVIGTTAALKHLPVLLATAAVIALVGALDSLLGAAAVDALSGGRHRADRELIAQGIGNIASALCGGVAIALSPAPAIAGWRAGGRTPTMAYASSALLLFLMLWGTRVLAHLPIAVLAGIMLVVAWNLVDTWTRSLARRLVASGADRRAWSSAVVVVLVASVMVAIDFIMAVIGGVFVSMALFIASMNRSLVRAVHDGTTRPSRRIYGPEDERRLATRRRRIRIIELEGAIFFGTAEGLNATVDALAKEDAAYLILDLKRITEIDATGALLLEQLVKRERSPSVTVLLAGVTAKGRHGAALLTYGTFGGKERRNWFRDADRAIEWAECQLLGDTETATHREIPLEQITLASGLDARELELLRRGLERRELDAEEILFHEGEPGSALYVLTRGAVSIVIRRSHGRDSRLITFAPGSLFGEGALLDGDVRSATAIAAEDAVVYSLSRSAFDALAQSSPATASKVLRNLGRHLSHRLRQTTDALRVP
jgi:sulfate permease, SulP family